MKKILIALIVSLISCKDGSNLPTPNKKDQLDIDTISCYQNRNLVTVNYYLQNKRIDYIPVGQKFRAKFIFEGEFRNILNNGEFNLTIDNDTISIIDKISKNEFEIFIDPLLNSDNFNYWMILKAKNTIFEWSYTIENKDFFEYSDTWKIMKSDPIKK